MTLKTCFRASLVLVSFLLTSCGTFFEKDNTPEPTVLTQFAPTLKPHQVWDNRIIYDASHERLQLDPVLTHLYVITVDTQGTITVVDKASGRTYWKPSINQAVSTGVAANDHWVIVGTRSGYIHALNLDSKKVVWSAFIGNEVLAPPAMNNRLVVAKTIDGRVSAYALDNGRFLWRHQESEPNLILRAGSAPQIVGNSVVVGFASGKVIKLSLENGHLQWSQIVATPEGAFAIERMIDIDANPVIFGQHVYVATYQGKLAALNLADGNVLWNNNISAYAGITVDSRYVYVSDAKGDVIAFNRENGNEAWKQTKLEYRNLTGPANLPTTIVVGDAGGALHWLNKQNGSFRARVQLGGKGIYSNPVAEDETVYVLTQDGYLVAYRV